MRKLAYFAGAAALALLAGAAHAQGVSADVVKIGVINDQSGLYADLGGRGSVVAAQMAIEDFGGEVLGKPIELVSADHQNKADIASSIARRWIDEENVDVITEATTSSVALALQGIAKEKNRLLLMSGPAASDLTGKACTPVGIHWTYDTYALANGTGNALVKDGGKTWFFITADYAFGHALERDTAAAVEKAGGKVLGAVRHPINTADFSSFLLQAQGSGAQVVGLANAGGDMINSVKQAAEFGIVAGGQRLAGLLVFVSDVHSLGLKAAQGIVLTSAFYWDQNEETRKFGKRFMERMDGRAPTMVQAGEYGLVMHYLKAVKAAGTDETKAVRAKMAEIPINDFMTKNGSIRADGRVMRDMYLMQVKAPGESKGPWDYLKVLRTIPAEEAFRPLAQSECPLVKN